MAALVDHPTLVLCLHRGVEVAGALAHRHLQCPAIEERATAPRGVVAEEMWRRRLEGEDDAKNDEGIISATTLKWEKVAVLQEESKLLVPAGRIEWVLGEASMDEGVAIYMDGSMMDGPGDETAVLG